MKRPPVVLGFTATIDTAYAAKLRLCILWDRALCIPPNSPLSAVAALNVCYAARRPYFAMADDIVDAMFPSRARQAIKKITTSPYGGHTVIEANFVR